MKKIRMLFALPALLLVPAASSIAQIPASELPPAGTDSGLDGKYDPQNGIAQLIRDKTKESAVGKIFEDEHVLVFMPLPEEEVVAPGHVLVVPKRMGARNLFDLKPDELRDLMVAVQKAATAQRKGLGATGFRVSPKQRHQRRSNCLPRTFSCGALLRRRAAGNTSAEKKACAGGIRHDRGQAARGLAEVGRHSYTTSYRVRPGFASRG